MRDYMTISNFWRALVLGAVVTAMALPRIMQAGDQVGVRIVGALLAMTLVAGAVTAWGGKAGMRGPYRGPAETARGIGLALLLALVLSPVQHWVVHPVFREAVRSSADAQWIRLQLPATGLDWVALALWAAGFQTLFCVAAPMCLAARLTGRVWPAIVVTVALSVLVATRQLTAYHVVGGGGVLYVAAAVEGLVACLLYLRSGLVASGVLSAGLQLHLLGEIG